MIKILLLTSAKESLTDFSSALVQEDNVELVIAASGGEALNILANRNINLVITDENLKDMTGLEFIRKLVMINPMIHCAALNSLSHDDFHEASEGLGILMQLPSSPGQKDAFDLLSHLNKILHLS